MPNGDAAPLPATLYDLLLEDREIPDLLNDLARLAAEHFDAERSVECGLILRREKKNIVVASSSDEAARMDEIQAGFDEGPCLSALGSGSVIHVPDVRTEQRWPDYMAVVREHGLASVLAVPLDVEGFGEAAMNFYTRRSGHFAESDVTDARRYVDVIGKTLRIALRTAQHADTARHRQAAMENRTAIDVAVGIIMAQNRCSQDEAFSILRGASSHRNIKLRRLAEEIVAALGQNAPLTAFDD
ncbi:GAF and ANTAR domain-containing protein [Dietzia lutea]|uniref:ANTAR domain-containing protein n=1 Tax=Dietzia lutea TaxID=546160 RepID=A0A2S1R3Y4_9ACTN|nr:GAF and ANTAR domain-containing protein [Dietzia lutea]AWH90961.1 hypothetical protein A6035_00810 [Dietzia lutea]